MDTDSRLHDARPHKCPYCGAAFKQRMHVGRHVKSQHPAYWDQWHAEHGSRRRRRGAALGPAPQADPDQGPPVLMQIDLPPGGVDLVVRTSDRKVIGTLRMTARGVNYRRVSSKASLNGRRIVWDKLDPAAEFLAS